MSRPENAYIPYGKQHICQSDIDAVVEVLTSDFLTQGPRVPAFEQEVAKLCEAKYACAMNSATSALHVACLALGVSQEDLVWTSPISFVASSNCALYCGADVDFVDVEESTGLMCPSALAKKLAQAKENNRLPKVLIPVHLAGHSCNMKAIFELCEQYNVRIIEDASHAIGGNYESKPIGNNHYCDITVFSFHPVKIITSAEGGMALTNNQVLYQQMKLYLSHGVTREGLNSEVSEYPWYYEQQALGFNYRMSDLHAALGLSQLNKVNAFIKDRNRLAENYLTQISSDPVLQSELTAVTPSSDSYSAYHLFIVRLTQADKRTDVFNKLRANNIGVNVHYIPICNQPYYQKLGFKPADFPNAQKYYESAISLPLYPSLTNEQQQDILSTLKEAL